MCTQPREYISLAGKLSFDIIVIHNYTTAIIGWQWWNTGFGSTQRASAREKLEWELAEMCEVRRPTPMTRKVIIIMAWSDSSGVPDSDATRTHAFRVYLSEALVHIKK